MKRTGIPKALSSEAPSKSPLLNQPLLDVKGLRVLGNPTNLARLMARSLCNKARSGWPACMASVYFAAAADVEDHNIKSTVRFGAVLLAYLQICHDCVKRARLHTLQLPNQGHAHCQHILCPVIATADHAPAWCPPNRSSGPSQAGSNALTVSHTSKYPSLQHLVLDLQCKDKLGYSHQRCTHRQNCTDSNREGLLFPTNSSNQRS